MAKRVNQLTSTKVKNLSETGRYPDGNGLYLQISQGGAKSWLFRYSRNKKARQMGLGSLHDVSLAEARQKLTQWRAVLLEGRDPLTVKRQEEIAIDRDESNSKTFSECVEAYINMQKAGWKNKKHAQQWENTLKTYVEPSIGNLPVASIDTNLVFNCLEPIWSSKSETASRVRSRIENILDWATVNNYRTGDNPARWRGHLDKMLPAIARVKTVTHHPALSFTEISNFMTDLSSADGVAAKALAFIVLTATRTSEVLGSTWDEINLDERIWSIPADRMKMKVEHRVPLSTAAIGLLEEMKKFGQVGYIFPGQKKDSPLSNMAMANVLKRLDRTNITVHGFRSTFNDWASETQSYPNEVIEKALAHAISNKSEAAYRRGDLLAKRRNLMDDWDEYCKR